MSRSAPSQNLPQLSREDGISIAVAVLGTAAPVLIAVPRPLPASLRPLSIFGTPEALIVSVGIGLL